MQRSLVVKGAHGRRIVINLDHIESIEEPVKPDIGLGIGARIRTISGQTIEVDHEFEKLCEQVLP